MREKIVPTVSTKNLHKRKKTHTTFQSTGLRSIPFGDVQQCSNTISVQPSESMSKKGCGLDYVWAKP